MVRIIVLQDRVTSSFLHWCDEKVSGMLSSLNSKNSSGPEPIRTSIL